ncbi:enoyl-CoA hydratase/isomerase family protein [Zhongshania aquimaris]|uniref:Enoyl-CoA hydratase/isomerase family protein n=1 Tax=Zhongshania aquimaris TaxID=2857107 RepID=A0ABS6VU62_9GAMM|nr:enoyl-CoA hydratase/isomerase family protein [Zhongshania aquimaris]MBW2941856.1 enoyl-CoA hydratase/isomerase family protein [Zhongshania aquimaris]
MQVEYSVCFERHPLPAGGYLAQLTLNAPARLNALTPEMVTLLHKLLLEIRDDQEAVAVFLDGAGERAFCVGADTLRIRESALANPGGTAVEADAFFSCEYAAAHLIHRFPKPVICWGSGIVMGAGLGLMVGGSHRIVTNKSTLAMPEISIGLFPNVGASWFLGQMPGATGLFTALTSAYLSPADALYAGLADYCLHDKNKTDVLRKIINLDWCDDSEWNAEQLTECLTDIEAEQGVVLQQSSLKDHRGWIDDVCALPSPAAVEMRICGYTGNSEWLQLAAQGLARGASSTAKLIFQQLQTGRNLSLADVFKMELVLSSNRVRDPEFAEGVRARLIDRDRDPRWCYKSIAEVPDSEIDALFESPWPINPLNKLFAL